MTDSPCGLFAGEVFADDNGVYLGDLPYGLPFGWISCMATCDPMSFFGCFRSFYKGYICECLGTFIGIHVPDAFGAGGIAVVTDLSGPTGLEAVPAMEVVLPGSPGCCIGWAGANPTSHVLGGGETIIDEPDPLWWPAEGEVWVFSCWAKIGAAIDYPVDDPPTLAFNVAPGGFSNGAPTSDVLTLTDEWQFYQTIFSGEFFPVSTFAWPLIAFGGGIENFGADHCDFFSDRIDITTYQKNGTVLIKCPHLYPLVSPGGNWIDSFHGHG